MLCRAISCSTSCDILFVCSGARYVTKRPVWSGGVVRVWRTVCCRYACVWAISVCCALFVCCMFGLWLSCWDGLVCPIFRLSLRVIVHTHGRTHEAYCCGTGGEACCCGTPSASCWRVQAAGARRLQPQASPCPLAAPCTRLCGCWE